MQFEARGPFFGEDYWWWVARGLEVSLFLYQCDACFVWMAGAGVFRACRCLFGVLEGGPLLLSLPLETEGGHVRAGSPAHSTHHSLGAGQPRVYKSRSADPVTSHLSPPRHQATAQSSKNRAKCNTPLSTAETNDSRNKAPDLKTLGNPMCSKTHLCTPSKPSSRPIFPLSFLAASRCLFSQTERRSLPKVRRAKKIPFGKRNPRKGKYHCADGVM